MEGLGLFDHAGILFAGVKVSPELLLLQKRVTQATEPCGFAAEARPYHPHITLARNKGQQPWLRELRSRIPQQQDLTGFVAEEFLLYESFLSAQGARHEVRDRFPLEGRQLSNSSLVV